MCISVISTWEGEYMLTASSGRFMSPAAAVWSLKAFTFPLLPGTRPWLALEWCIPANGPTKYSLWDQGNSQVYVRDIQAHTHTAAFCGCEFMGWGNDKDSSQRVALWSPLLSLATSGFTVNNWAAIEGRKRNAEGEYERKTDKFIYPGTMGHADYKEAEICAFFLRLLFVIMDICDYFVCFCSCISIFIWWCHCCFISVLPKSQLSLAVWPICWYILSLCLYCSFISVFNHRDYQTNFPVLLQWLLEEVQSLILSYIL